MDKVKSLVTLVKQLIKDSRKDSYSMDMTVLNALCAGTFKVSDMSYANGDPEHLRIKVKFLKEHRYELEDAVFEGDELCEAFMQVNSARQVELTVLNCRDEEIIFINNKTGGGKSYAK